MEKGPYEIKFKDESKKLTIKFSGNLVINHIEEICNIVFEKTDVKKSLHLNIANPDTIDLTFIQFVLSLQKTYLNKDVDFSVTAKLRDDLKLLLGNAGFQLFLN
jgi:hypothetical protein